MIFIWFMRERGLVPKILFEKQKIVDVLKDLKHEESTYYLAILQNLFFATLSTKNEERQFSSDIKGYKGNNPDFGNQYVFRHQELFTHPDKIKEYFGDIPFLNGGLFECLDDKKNGIIIDGFSRVKKNQPNVPNLLFFSHEKGVDLNKIYDTKNKSYKVRGLLDILSSFNFTIDENSPDDADVALDPELLGRVFENLLASFNPETSTTARKATGSYYTPREIVNYMVSESLKSYFKTSLEGFEDIDEKLEKLFSHESMDNPFDRAQTKKLVGLIEGVKIVDPAVGSGAFPMGALNKLVFILNKIDPGNALWKEVQLKAADTIPDPSARRLTKERIEEFFKGKNSDYGRKLYLIQRCIYGVDIQQIAVEIAKLRFFISLLVDEKIDKDKYNWGIEPLPNLDFKIMQGNSLISEFLGVDFDNGNSKQEYQSGLPLEDKEGSLIEDFEQKKIEFQNEADKDKKSKLKQEAEDLMILIFKHKLKNQKGDYFRRIKEIEENYSNLPNKIQREKLIIQEKQKLSIKYGFDLDNIEKKLRDFTSKKKTRSFFPWKLYFAEVFEKGGFDVVIANPPYISAVTMARDKSQKEYFKKAYPLLSGSYDIYILFLLKAMDLLNKTGAYAWIIPNKFLISDYAKKCKEYLIKENGLTSSIDVSSFKVFKETGVYPIIILGKKGSSKGYKALSLYKYEDLGRRVFQKAKELKQHKTFKEYGIKLYSGTTGFQAQQIVPFIEIKKNTDSIPFIVSGSVDRYCWSNKNVRYMNKYYPIAFINKNNVIADSKWQFWNSPKIIISGMTKVIESVYSAEPVALGVGIYGIYDFAGFEPKCLNGLLNSKYMTFYFQQKFKDKHLAGGYLGINKSTIEELPLVDIDKDEQKKISDLVDKILVITKSADYLQNPDKQTKVKEYEKQIDELVYKLYELTPEEIDIVEGE